MNCRVELLIRITWTDEIDILVRDDFRNYSSGFYNIAHEVERTVTEENRRRQKEDEPSGHTHLSFASCELNATFHLILNPDQLGRAFGGFITSSSCCCFASNLLVLVNIHDSQIIFPKPSLLCQGIMIFA